MPEFTRAEELHDLEPIPQPKWRKDAPASVVLFATDGRGTVVIIDSQGADVAYAQSEMPDELLRELAEHKFPGLWVWMGRVRTQQCLDGDWDAWVEGEVRPLTDDERRAVNANDHVWDGSLWIEDWKP